MFYELNGELFIEQSDGTFCGIQLLKAEGIIGFYLTGDDAVETLAGSYSVLTRNEVLARYGSDVPDYPEFTAEPAKADVADKE